MKSIPEFIDERENMSTQHQQDVERALRLGDHIANRLSQCEQQRDELLATLEYCAAVLTAKGGPLPTERRKAADQARALITKIKEEE